MLSPNTRLNPGEYFGSVDTSYNLQSAMLTESAYGPGTTIAPHSHALPYLCLVTGGVFDEHSDGRMVTCPQSTLIYHPADEIHSDQFRESGGTCFNIEFDSRRAWKEIDSVEAWPESRLIFRNTRINDIAADLLREFRNRGDSSSPVSDLVLQSLLFSVAAELIRAPGQSTQKRPPYLSRVLELLHDRYLSDVTLKDAADEAGVHPTHLTRVFRHHVGCTIGEYLRNLRVETAKWRLLNSDEAISTIAHDLGFADHSHFTRTFRQITGTTPSLYRSADFEC